MIRLKIDGDLTRNVEWRSELSGDEVRDLFAYATGESWMDGWDPVADVINKR